MRHSSIERNTRFCRADREASMRLAKLVAVGAHDVGDFQGWPHWRRGLGFWINNGQREQIQAGW